MTRLRINSVNVEEMPVVNRKAAYWVCIIGAKGGVRIKGKVKDPEEQQVRLVINRVIIKDISLVDDGANYVFSTSLKSKFLAEVPAGARLSVIHGAKRVAQKNGSLEMTLPAAGNETAFAKKLEAGYYLTKKGDLRLPISRTSSEARRRFVAEYVSLAKDFEQITGYSLWLAHGTLLGLIRENGFLEEDDDFDLAYVSTADTVEAVCAERFEIALNLLRAGYNVKLSSPSGLIKVRGLGANVDIMPGWFQGGMFWCLAYTMLPLNRADILPVGESELEGLPVKVPAEPEKFLAAKYGPNWKTPDSGYKAKRPPGSFETLNRGRMSREQSAAINRKLKELLSASKET